MKILIALTLLTSGMLSAQEPQLIGGREANPKDWPASVYVSSGSSRCSATVVGEKSLLVAAHCIKDGGKLYFSIGPNRYTSVCSHSIDYKKDKTADYALCIIDKPVTGIEFENINIDPSLIKLNDEVLLTGYGCIKPGGGGGNDGTYRVGEAKVIALPGRTNDIVTAKGAALCFGDSGGPAFKYLDKEKAVRVLISVNSRGNTVDTSYLSATHTAEALKFFKSWSSKTGQKICGLDVQAVGCKKLIEPCRP